MVLLEGAVVGEVRVGGFDGLVHVGEDVMDVVWTQVLLAVGEEEEIGVALKGRQKLRRQLIVEDVASGLDYDLDMAGNGEIPAMGVVVDRA